VEAETFWAPSGDRVSTPVTFAITSVSPAYFDLFADRPTAGRGLSESDRLDACRAAVIARAGAETVFGGHAIGAALIAPDGERIEIVGQVDAAPLGAAQRAAAPMVYFPIAQMFVPRVTLAVRAADAGESTRRAIADRIQQLAGEVPRRVSTFEDYLAQTSLASERIATALMAMCAGLALGVSLVGVYGVMTDTVVRRRRELALRIALGANALRLVGHVAAAGLRLAGAGAAIGLALSLVAAPQMDRFMRTPDLPGPATIAAALAALALLVAVACVIPAWRAVRVDPRMILSDE
jgi:hypothetical protein